MFDKASPICMFFLFVLPKADEIDWQRVALAGLFFDYCCYCGCALLLSMSSVPQGAFLAAKIRQNEKKKCNANYNEMNQNLEMNPLHYNSKMMNSIWGLYNRYSVHNLKKNIDKNVTLAPVNQQMQPVGTTASGSVYTTAPVFTSAWSFGNTH